MNQVETQSVEALNSLLRGEISAVETYRQALEKLGQHGSRVQLQQCERSHQQRVAKLQDRIRQLGGDPSKSSGPWGTFAKLVEGGAKAFGEKAAIQALEQGEDFGLNDYRNEISKLDPESRRLVESELMPEQEHTHATLSGIKRTLH